jgi:phage shock protein PspC (stress-responsive transcriptional regulator)
MKKIYRSQNRIIAGVCGGVGEYLEIDPVLVRLVWGVLFLFGGIGLLAYLVAWMIIPSTDVFTISSVKPNEEKASGIRTSYKVQIVIGLFLILMGFTMLMRDWWYFDSLIRDLIRIGWRYLIPAFLVGIGVYIIFKGDSTRKQ